MLELLPVSTLVCLIPLQRRRTTEPQDRRFGQLLLQDHFASTLEIGIQRLEEESRTVIATFEPLRFFHAIRDSSASKTRHVDFTPIT